MIHTPSRLEGRVGLEPIYGNCVLISEMSGVPTERCKPCDCVYRCIERVSRSVGALLCCDRGHSLKWVPTERCKPCDCVYRCIERVSRSVGALLCCDRGHSLKWVSTKKGVFFCFDEIQTCLIFPLRWTSFPIKICRNTQWEHLFSMYFDEFLTIYLIF